MRPQNLERLLEMWARWIQNGCCLPSGNGFASMLEMMMETRCQFNGGGGLPPDVLETKVEGAVSLLAKADKLAALVIRIEYGAWRLPNMRTNAKQIDKAHALRMPLRTYERKLCAGRRFIAEKLGISR